MFSDRLKALREDHDLTQSELSKKLKISRTALSNYETGFREPNLEILISIADYFNVTLDYLLGRTNINKPFKNKK